MKHLMLYLKNIHADIKEMLSANFFKNELVLSNFLGGNEKLGLLQLYIDETIIYICNTFWFFAAIKKLLFKN